MWSVDRESKERTESGSRSVLKGIERSTGAAATERSTVKRERGARLRSMEKTMQEETRKGPWTEVEDTQLIFFVQLFGDRRWDAIARASGLRRTGKSCRLRWVNYLRPGLKRGPITPEEECLILELHSQWGNRWSRIARRIPGRTDNEIKNYWRTLTRKKAQDRKRSPSPGLSSSSSSSYLLHGAQLVDTAVAVDQAAPSHVGDGSPTVVTSGETQMGLPMGCDGQLLPSEQIWNQMNAHSSDMSVLACCGWRMVHEASCDLSCSPVAADEPSWAYSCCDTSLWKMDDLEMVNTLIPPTGYSSGGCSGCQQEAETLEIDRT